MLLTADTSYAELHLVFLSTTAIDWNNACGGLKMPMTSELLDAFEEGGGTIYQSLAAFPAYR
jgi:hypothetical protein